MKSLQIRRLTVSAVMLALATVLALVCGLIPFLQLPMGGGVHHRQYVAHCDRIIHVRCEMGVLCFLYLFGDPGGDGPGTGAQGVGAHGVVYAVE